MQEFLDWLTASGVEPWMLAVGGLGMLVVGLLILTGRSPGEAGSGDDDFNWGGGA